jgi:quercetin dioxygenase-like cupin family protein
VRRIHVSAREIDAHGSRGLNITPLARVLTSVDGFAVDVARYAPGAENGRHPGRLWQLLAVVSGEGWAAGADDERVPLARGDAVLWEPGEEHTSGSTHGMVALIVQSPEPPLE